MTYQRGYAVLRRLREPENCSCATCRDMCTNPCWPTPDEAEKLIEFGHAQSLEVRRYDYGWDDDSEYVHLLAPKEVRDDGGYRCVFYQLGKCKLHDIAKPIEGRMAHHSHKLGGPYAYVHGAVASTWRSKRGRAIVAQWRATNDAL